MTKNFKSAICILLCFVLTFVLFFGCGADTDTAELDNKIVSESNKTKTLADSGVSLDTQTTIPSDAANEDNLEADPLSDYYNLTENRSIPKSIKGKGESLLGKCNGLTYYSQADKRWATKIYSNHNDKSQTMKSSGCGPTAAAMIVSSSRGAILPPTMADLFVKNGFRTYNNGTAWACWGFVADYFGFSFYRSTSSFEMAKKYFSVDKNKDGVSDYFVVVSCANGLFTTSGHYVNIMGYSGDTLLIYDPYLYAGKFDTPSRRPAKVKVVSDKVYVKEAAFKKYAKVKNYWIYSNDCKMKLNTTTKPATTKPTTGDKKPVTKYVKTNGANLNVRSGAGTKYSVVRRIKNKTKVTVYEAKSGWSRISKTKNEWVSSSYLASKAPTPKKEKIAKVYIPATGRTAYCKYSAIKKVNGIYRLKSATTLYSKSNLTGTKYSYLANTSVVIKETIN